jgi:hypothetical protein
MPPKSDVIPPGYVRKPEALQYLKTSKNTLDRLIEREKVESRLVPRSGGPDIRVISLASLERVKNSGILNKKPEPRRENGIVPARDADVWWQAFMEFAQRGQRAQEETTRLLAAASEKTAAHEESRVKLEEARTKLWLTLRQAARYSGLPRPALLAAITEEKIVADHLGPKGRLLVNRASLEEYRG